MRRSYKNSVDSGIQTRCSGISSQPSYVFTDVVDQTNSAGKNFGEWVSSDESDGTVSALESASVTVDTASGKLEARDIALGEPSMLDPQQVEQLVLQQNMRDAAQNQISGS